VVEGRELAVVEGKGLAVVEGKGLAEVEGRESAEVEGEEWVEVEGKAPALVWEQGVGMDMDVHIDIHMVVGREGTGNHHSSHSTCHMLH